MQKPQHCISWGAYEETFKLDNNEYSVKTKKEKLRKCLSSLDIVRIKQFLHTTKKIKLLTYEMFRNNLFFEKIH